MRAALVTFALAIPAFAFPPDRPDNKGPTSGPKALEGDWRIVAVTKRGEKAPSDAIGDTYMRFEGSKLTLIEKGRKSPDVSRVAIDWTKKPVAIELTQWNRADVPLSGILRLDGDKLEFCFGDPGNNRPTTFEAPPGSRLTLIELRRTPKINAKDVPMPAPAPAPDGK